MALLPRFPDLLTTANLCCGAGSILLASQGQLTTACVLVFVGAVFDVLDGLAARALGGGSALGAQLDSLADLVTFGVAPGMIAAIAPYKALLLTLNSARESVTNVGGVPFEVFGEPLWMTVAIILVIASTSAWRLAKFNIDDRQTTGFRGLPTPANALFWASLGMVSWGIGIGKGPFAKDILDLLQLVSDTPVVKLGLAVALGVLMLSELPLPGLKFMHFKWQGNQVIYLLGVIGLVLLLLYGTLAVPMLLFLYLLSPFWGRLFPKTP